MDEFSPKTRQTHFNLARFQSSSLKPRPNLARPGTETRAKRRRPEHLRNILAQVPTRCRCLGLRLHLVEALHCVRANGVGEGAWNAGAGLRGQTSVGEDV